MTPGSQASLARVYGAALSAALVALGLGLVVPPVAWLGVAALVLGPVVAALLVAKQNVSANPGVLWGVVWALVGVVVAALVGLWIRR